MPNDSSRSDLQTVHLEGRQLHARSFLLGNGSGLVYLAPVSLNTADRVIVPHKWFGVSAYGRKYLEANRVWVRFGDREDHHLLSKRNQVAFDQHLTEAVRTFHVEGITVRERFFVPRGISAFKLTLESDRPATFIVEPQFDMRYYQAFNTDFSHYWAAVKESNGCPVLAVGNKVEGLLAEPLKFSTVMRTADSRGDVRLRPEHDRLLRREYLKDEHREKLIHKAYSEIHDQSPDEAPIWDSYQTQVYVPAEITVESPVVLIFGFDPEEEDATDALNSTMDLDSVTASQEGKSPNRAAADRADGDSLSYARSFLERALFRTGDHEIDLAYNQILTRFNSALVVRNGQLRTNSGVQTSAIFAGDKYFLDPWKRDENISLEGLLACNDFETVREILDSTWQHQDEATGRLPQILRLHEPIVYFSSDGTLWALRRLAEYTRMSGDTSLLQAKLPMVERFLETSLKSCRKGLLPSGGVLEAGFLWETWMDTAFTPREGYPAEIELLWLANLRECLPWFKDANADLADRMENAFRSGSESLARFLVMGSGDLERDPSYLADSLDYVAEPRDLFTPNGCLAAALEVPLPDGFSEKLVAAARRHLAGTVGVKSLAQRDWPKEFPPQFLDDPDNVKGGELNSVGIYNYHRGIEWLWFNPFMVALELKYGDADHAYRHYIRGLVRSTLDKSGVGGLDELGDLHGPLGADFQAWSMAGFVAGLRRFAGVRVDALRREIDVFPQLPSSWPYLRSRNRVGPNYFEVEVRRREDGGCAIRVSHESRDTEEFDQTIRCLAPADAVVKVDGTKLDPRHPGEGDLGGRQILEISANGSVLVEVSPMVERV